MGYKQLTNEAGTPLGELPESKEGGRLRDIVYITSTQAYEKPDWLKFVLAKGVGGGGGGGGAGTTGGTTVSLGAGGAAGGYFAKKIAAGDLAASETVTIGAGGNGATAGTGNGSAGGTTSFGTHCSATGGAGGGGCAADANASGLGAVGGSATGGDRNLDGTSSWQTRAITAAAVVQGLGAPSALGAWGPPQTANAAGDTGKNYGSGGNGGRNNASQATARAGGNGAPGIVIIEEYE